MYVYRLRTVVYNIPSLEQQTERYDIHERNDKYYSSSAKAVEMLEKRRARRINRSNHKVLSHSGEPTLRQCDTYSVTLVDSDQDYKEYGYHTCTEFTVIKIEVE